MEGFLIIIALVLACSATFSSPGGGNVIQKPRPKTKRPPPPVGQGTKGCG